MTHGTFWTRWRNGVGWMWVNEPYQAYLPHRETDWVMNLETRDRYHAKQGRSTARVILHAAGARGARPLSLYLKRHYQLPLRERMLALVDPSGPHTPAAAEWRHLERVRSLGVRVPEVVAVGGRTGPRGRLQSFLMIAELTASEPLNELLPTLPPIVGQARFEVLKRGLAAEMARITATLHNAGVFHSDLYLCHFFMDQAHVVSPTDPPTLALIDLHRAVEPRLGRFWKRWKDLGQLLYSTIELDCVTDRDRLRFLVHYGRLAGIRRQRLLARMVKFRAARYLAHNQKGGS